MENIYTENVHTKKFDKLLYRLNKAKVNYSYILEDEGYLFDVEGHNIVYTQHALERIKARTVLGLKNLDIILDSINNGLVIREKVLNKRKKVMYVSDYDSICDGEVYFVLKDNLLYVLKKEIDKGILPKEGNKRVLLSVLMTSYHEELYLKQFENGDVCDYISYNNLYRKYFGKDYQKESKSKKKRYHLNSFMFAYNYRPEFALKF